MTRETKIGLLVGLAFIIVIGILLSDHLTTSNEPPPAQLAQAGASIRGGIAIPGAQSAQAAAVVAPANVTPQAMVPTPGDLASGSSGTEQIAIGPGVAQPAVAAAVSREAAPISGDQSTLAAAAAHQGEQLVSVPAVGHEPTRLVPQTSSTGRSYQAVSGDTLSGIAAKLPGGNSKANREALIAVNPDLKSNPNLIVAGRTYNLPATAAAAVAGKAAPQPAAHSAQAATTPQRWYTVKPGDSLWKIANEQTGTPSTLDTIRRLNKETLNGKDVVRVGMKLRLPAHNEVATTD